MEEEKLHGRMWNGGGFVKAPFGKQEKGRENGDGNIFFLNLSLVRQVGKWMGGETSRHC